MVVIELKGGLGNQLFQFAAARALALKNKCSLKIDVSFFDRTADIVRDDFTPRSYKLSIFRNLNAASPGSIELNKFSNVSLWNSMKKKAGFSHYKIFEEKSFNYNDIFFKLQSPVYLKGYFTSEKYFKEYTPEIREAFVFPELKREDTNVSMLKSITENLSISIHVRRGDYLKQGILEYHGVCDEIYYQKAIEIMRNKYPNSMLYFFSDDESWVSENLLKKYPDSFLVSGNYGDHSWKDMYLMSCCKHHILANSTFSWWGAWLNDSSDKFVIAPKEWFKTKNLNTSTLLPDEWMKI